MNDKIKHFLAGTAVAAVSAIAWFLVSRSGLVDMGGAWLCVVMCAGVAGVVKEGADREDNRIHPGMHGVELADALATLAGAAPVVAVIIGLQHLAV